ncbi:hypothetical protein [Qipengyuania thermophila]|uniref:hypothetical protein n=1 Tax=Qipengyuania thermophila TaxID=2509361 RepID=UPI0018F8AC44|nr:hypothetical protein [Qipengyuania thermophila]
MRDAIEACHVAAKRSKGSMSPLDFMLAVMRDEEQDLKLRAAMAQAAAPYVHAKPADVAKGKKEQQNEDAQQIAASGKFAPRRSPKLVVSNV